MDKAPPWNAPRVACVPRVAAHRGIRSSPTDVVCFLPPRIEEATPSAVLSEPRWIGRKEANTSRTASHPIPVRLPLVRVAVFMSGSAAALLPPSGTEGQASAVRPAAGRSLDAEVLAERVVAMMGVRLVPGARAPTVAAGRLWSAPGPENEATGD